ncbi:hypothetical protein E4U58_007375 [Claviceps cyperi]|nr:hypothetical protein E4U58_007375 [Claviceps cyperi]
MDTTPCTSIRVALDYIAKYCSKAEVPTAYYTDIAKSIFPHVSDSRPVVSLAAKLLNKLITERDWSAQEDRDAVVDIPDTDGNRQPTRPRRSLYVKYLERDVEYEATTFLTFLTRHNTNRPQPQRLADEVRDRILSYVPRSRSDPEHPTFHRVITWGTISTTYGIEILAGYGLTTYEIRTLEEEIDEFEAPDLGEESNDAYFQELLDAGLREPRRPRTSSVRSYSNWDVYVGKYSEELPELLLPTAKDEYWKSLKAPTSINLDYGTEASNAEASLNPEQRLLFQTIVEHYEHALEGLSPDPLRVNVDGRAGTGRSYTIQLVSSRLDTIQRSRFYTSPHRSPVTRIAPTGAAANGIHGYTDHAYFDLSVQRFETLSPLGPDGVSAIRKHLEAERLFLSPGLRQQLVWRHCLPTGTRGYAEGNPDLTDFRTLEPRLLYTLERRGRTTFEEQVVYLSATRASADDMNYSRLREAMYLSYSSAHGIVTRDMVRSRVRS